MKHELESFDSFRERLCEMFDKSDWTDLTTDRRIWKKDDWFTGPYLPSQEEMEYEIKVKMEAASPIDFDAKREYQHAYGNRF